MTPLDLSDDAVRRHWAAQGIARLISAMERCEPWAVDVRPDSKAKAEIVVADIARHLSATSASALSASVASKSELMIDFLGFMRSGRALALFTWLTEVDPSIAQQLVSAARRSGDEFGSILIERITTLEKQNLLSRVFAPERIALVLELLAEAGLADAD